MRELIKEKNFSFITLTEYSFLYCDYNKEPPKNLPVWFDEGISFFPENINNIAETIIKENPRIIFIQDAHGHDDPELNEKLIELFISKGWDKKEEIEVGKADASIIALIKN